MTINEDKLKELILELVKQVAPGYIHRKSFWLNLLEDSFPDIDDVPEKMGYSDNNYYGNKEPEQKKKDSLEDVEKKNEDKVADRTPEEIKEGQKEATESMNKIKEAEENVKTKTSKTEGSKDSTPS